MIKLIRHGLENRPEGQAGNFVFVEFNAWLYQGYDDARAALLEVIATCASHLSHPGCIKNADRSAGTGDGTIFAVRRA